MKRSVLLVFFLLMVYVGTAQDPKLTGVWTMCEMTHRTPEGNQVMSEDEMKAESYVTDYYFMDDGLFKQSSNMSGSGTMDTYEGTWELLENELLIRLKVNEQMMDIVWDVEMIDDRMNLSRTSPDGSFTVINTFRKKA